MPIKIEKKSRNLLLLTMVLIKFSFTGSFSMSGYRSWSSAIETEDNENNTPYSSMVSYDGYQLWHLQADSPEKLKAVKDLDIVEVTRWGINRSNPDVLISKGNVERVRNQLSKSKIKHEVLIQNLQKEINNVPLADTADMKLTQKVETFNLSQYHSLPIIRHYLNALTNKHNHVKIVTIGKTYKRNNIEVVTVSGRSNNKHGVFIEAGIHAREWVSPASVLWIINLFANHFHDETETIQKLDWHFLPIGNPDGYIYSYTKDRLWRKNRSRWGNCYGTDLNRNFGFHWDLGDPNPCEETFSGSQPFSELETTAIRDYIGKFHRDYWKAYISIHSYGQYILYPFGYNRVVPDNVNELIYVGQTAINAIKQLYRSDYALNSVADIYLAAGVSVDWSRSIGIQYSYAVELRDKGKHAFLLPAKYIVPTAEELLYALRVIAESAYRDVSKKSITV